MEDKKDKVYLFKISLKLRKQQIHREMAVKGESSLERLASSITSAYDFDFDHAFGFYSNLNNMYESKEVYTLFKDEGKCIMANERSVKKSHVHEVFEPNKKMLFYYDFGDSWNFIVECCAIVEPEEGKNYPIVTKKQGQAPPQYPQQLPSDEECSDEEFSDEDEELSDEEMSDEECSDDEDISEDDC